MDQQVEQLYSQAESLVAKFEQEGNASFINEAIVFGREALTLCPSGHLKRSVSLTCLAIHLFTRYYHFGSMENLHEAIDLDREALVLRPLGHPDRWLSLNHLAEHLRTRYNVLGSVDELNEAIVLARGALALCPLGHPGRSQCLHRLAVCLSEEYDRLGSVEDLNEAIVLAQAALALRPPGHPDRCKTLNNLGIYFDFRYWYSGSVEDLNKSIAFRRDALALRSPRHPGRCVYLNNMAVGLYGRYKQLGSIEDLNEAIALDLDTLALCPPGHPQRPMSLGNLAVHLSSRYKQLGSVDDINEAIVLSRDALTLRPPGHPTRPLTMSNLGSQLYSRYEQLNAVEDINEAISIDRSVLACSPPTDPLYSAYLDHLATHLCMRYKQLSSMDDLNEAIALDRHALALRPQGHPERSESLGNLAEHLSIRFTSLSQSPQDKEESFSLYAQLAHAPPMASSTDMHIVRSWINVAENLQHPTTLLAYETSLRFLTHHVATLPSLPRHLAVLKRLSSSLAVDAFSASLRSKSLTNAVELLEQGRGIFWSQLTRLHSPIDDVIASGLEGKTAADEFTRLTSLIRNIMDSPGRDQHDRICDLNVRLEKVVTNIRSLSGLERFLLPPLFFHLRQAAQQGPVIIVNASKYGCDALIVLLDQSPIHIPLSITKDEVRELSSQLRTLTIRAKSMDMGREFCIFLRGLWDEIVSPIIDSLRVKCPAHSRIWWCPTAEFSVLPLHAAGPFRKGQRNLPHLYVSSYTPTLTALIRARSQRPLSRPSEPKRFVAIGQANAAGVNELFSVGTELARVGERVDGLATFTRVEGQESTIERVTGELSKNEWAHFACHGIPNRKQPFESAFALRDGRLTIDRIIRCELEDPQFAYLSACHTTVGDEESPDEVIHLASAMQFAGFRSVIGTMWAVDDAETNKITSMFYDNMKDESGCLDYTRAAYALNKTMKKLVDVPFDQRILYIHLGA